MKMQAHDRVRLSFEYLALGTVERVNWAKGTCIVVLDAPLPTNQTGKSERKISDLVVLASATRGKGGALRRDMVSLVGHALASGEEADIAAWADALVNEALYPDSKTVGRLRRRKK